MQRPAACFQAVSNAKLAAAGTVLGVDDEGALLLKTGRGRTHRFPAGEVTLEKTPAA